MPKDKGPEWNHVLVLDDASKNLAFARMQCSYCDKVYSGGVNRIRTHLAGDGTSVGKCESAPDSVIAEMLAANKERLRLDALKKKKNLLDKATKTPATGSKDVPSLKQSSITSTLHIGSKQLADAAVARAFYANGIPFAVIENKYFKEAVHAISQAGPGYKAPGRQPISDKLLTEEFAQVDGKLGDFKGQLVISGGTLVSDGCSESSYHLLPRSYWRRCLLMLLTHPDRLRMLTSLPLSWRGASTPSVLGTLSRL